MDVISKPALFLDRDGVINKEVNYLFKQSEFEFLNGIFELCRKAADAGYLIFIVTNQAGIGRGYYSESDFKSLTNWMRQEFLSRNINIAAVKYCPHHPVHGLGQYKANCYFRKPNPGMINELVKEYGIDAARSILVGDKITDIQAARNAGIGKSVLVLTGHKVTETDIDEAGLVCNSVIDVIAHL